MTKTITILDDFSVNPTKSLDFEDQSGFMFAANHDASLVNRGDVYVHGAGDLWGFRLVGAFSNGSDFYFHSVFHNAAGADFRVNAVGAGMEAFGYLTVSWGPRFQNDGDFSVRCVEGDAWGVSTVSSGDSFINTGRFKVEAGTTAFGVGLGNGGSYENSGLMLVHGATGATGMGLGYYDSTADNSGRILVSSDDPDQKSIGIGLGPAHHVVVNSGLIEADWAIYAYASENWKRYEITNTGTMRGDVLLQDGRDSFVNSGSIVGQVDLGAGHDTFDGTGGHVSGAVLGGLGNDVLTGGNGADLLFGDQGEAGKHDGDDLLSGGRGADVLTGGGGSDTFVYHAVADSTAARADVITDLGDGDVIDLSAIDANAGQAGDQAFHLVVALDGGAGELALSYDAANDLTLASGDVDGDGVADLVITLAGDHRDFTGFAL